MTISPDDITAEIDVRGGIAIQSAAPGNVLVEIATTPGPGEVVVSLEPGSSTLDGFKTDPIAVDIVTKFDGVAPENNPVFTYSAGLLARIDYASGNYKLFTWAAGVLTRVDYVAGGVTTRKTFTYAAGLLASVTETVLP